MQPSSNVCKTARNDRDVESPDTRFSARSQPSVRGRSVLIQKEITHPSHWQGNGQPPSRAAMRSRETDFALRRPLPGRKFRRSGNGSSRVS